ncbi:MAG TPA: hypothetical protein VNU44_10480 [Bryobacteraceae bacterium]|jgi:hypothetical protein|nr:hypothetical protein [Bryobacteraceae bacterium]
MRQILSLTLTMAMLTGLASATPDTAILTTQIVAMPQGANIELRLKNKEKLRGAKGAVSNTGFALLGAHAVERQIAFDDVVSVKSFNPKSHTTRNVLIIVGIGVVATVGIIAAVALRCAPLGCNSKL